MPLTETGAYLIGTGISAAASGANIAANAVRNKKSYKYTKKLAEFQNDIALRNWNRQNDYNTPSAQMQRLKLAGLNPNLIYQNGGSMTGAGEIGAPSTSQFSTEAPQFGNLAQSFNSAVSAAMLPDSVQAAIRNQTADAVGKEADNVLKIENSKYASKEAKLRIRGMEIANAVSEQHQKLLSAQTGLTTAQTQEAILNWSKIPVEINKLRSEIRLNDKSLEQLNSAIRLANAQTDATIAGYQKALIEKALLDLKYAAETGVDQNTFQLMIQQLFEQVDALHYQNTDWYRGYQSFPDIKEPYKVPLWLDRPKHRNNSPGSHQPRIGGASGKW